MHSESEKTSTSAGWYLLGGLIVGAAAGILLAPQSGAETREDLERFRRRSAERARSLFARVGDAIPSRVKVAAAVGAARGAAKETASEVRDGFKKFG